MCLFLCPRRVPLCDWVVVGVVLTWACGAAHGCGVARAVAAKKRRTVKCIVGGQNKLVVSLRAALKKAGYFRWAKTSFHLVYAPSILRY